MSSEVGRRITQLSHCSRPFADSLDSSFANRARNHSRDGGGSFSYSEIAGSLKTANIPSACAAVCGSSVRLPVWMTRMCLNSTPTERQLWTNAIGLPGDRRRNFTATLSAACQVEAFGIRIRVDGHGGGPASKSGLKGVSHQCAPDSAVHELWQDPKMVELPRVIRRHQGVEAGNLISDRRHEGRPRGNCVARDAEFPLPRFDRVGRVAPIRFRLERERRKDF